MVFMITKDGIRVEVPLFEVPENLQKGLKIEFQRIDKMDKLFHKWEREYEKGILRDPMKMTILILETTHEHELDLWFLEDKNPVVMEQKITVIKNGEVILSLSTRYMDDSKKLFLELRRIYKIDEGWDL